MSLPAAIALLRAAYPRADFPEETIRVYAELLRDLPEQALVDATQRVIRRSTFLPAVAELRREVIEDDLRLPTVEEAWDIACAGSLRDAPPEVQAAARACGGRWSILQSENVEVVRSQFAKDYTARRERTVRALMVGDQRPALPPAVGAPRVERTPTPEGLDEPREPMRPIVRRVVLILANQLASDAPTEAERQDAIRVLEAGPGDPDDPAGDRIYAEAERVMHLTTWEAMSAPHERR